MLAGNQKYNALIRRRYCIAAAVLLGVAICAAAIWFGPANRSSETASQTGQPSPAGPMEPAGANALSFLILPDVSEASTEYAASYLPATLPGDYEVRLRKSSLEIDEVTATVREKIHWPERDRAILLIGVQPRSDGAAGMIEIPRTNVAVGHELVRRLRLDDGDPLIIRGQTFQIFSCLPQRNSADDETIWMRLDDCQSLLGVSNQVTALRAVVRRDDRSPSEIRRIIEEILPETRAY